MRRISILALASMLTAPFTVGTDALAQSSDPPSHRDTAIEKNAIGPEAPSTAEPGFDRIEHLRQAAEHLKSAGESELAEQVARAVLAEEKRLPIRQRQANPEEFRVTNSSDQKVTLRVKVMELQLTRMRELGVEFDVPEGTGVLPESLLSALLGRDLIKVLAEPVFVTVSGRPATFQTGGEFPVVVPQKDGQVAVQYCKFGTRMDCLAEILANGRIRVVLRPDISELDHTRTVTIQGVSVPGLRTRSLNTTVEMNPGETIVLGGLVQSRSKSADPSQVEETALLISVTADIGEPGIQNEAAE